MSTPARCDWALPLIGRPWTRLGQGPDAFSCWGLVRHFVRVRFGLEFPMIRDESNVAAIKQAAEISGMSRVFGARARPGHEDIVVMRSPDGSTHCGVVLRVNGRTQVLHSFQGAGVCLQPWTEAIDGTVPELWRIQRCRTTRQ